jgi:cystathionine beta-lyase
MKRRHGWEIRDEWIIESRGVVEGFDTSVRAFTEEDDGVLVMTPVYYPMYWAIERNHRRVVETRLVPRGNRYEIDWADLEEKAGKAKVLLFCSPHNPVGRVWTREELERIGRICIDRGMVIISDEIHHDLVMPGYSHTVFAAISEEFAQNSVIHTAPSKTFNLAGMQISNTIIPNPDLRRKYRTRGFPGCLSPQCGILGYEACRLAYDYGEPWLEEVIPVIRHNGALIRERIERDFPEIRVFDLEGTYLLWLDFNALGLDYRELERRMQQEGELFFDEGYIFGEGGRGFERWNLACPSRFIEQGLDRLERVLKRGGTQNQ